MEIDRNIETFDFLRTRWPRENVLKALLRLNDMKQKELAHHAGIGVPSMQSTINRNRNHPKAMAAVSQYLGIPARELFDGKK